MMWMKFVIGSNAYVKIAVSKLLWLYGLCLLF